MSPPDVEGLLAREGPEAEASLASRESAMGSPDAGKPPSDRA